MDTLSVYQYRDDLAMMTDGAGGVLFYDPADAVDLEGAA